MASDQPRKIRKSNPSVVPNERMLTVSEVAQLLNVHINTVRRWADVGLLTGYRIGVRGDRRFRSDDVASFLVSWLNR